MSALPIDAHAHAPRIDASSEPRVILPGAWRLAVVALAVLACGLAAWMALDPRGSLTGGGCDECDRLRTTLWSRWMGVPVAWMGLAVYAGIAAAGWRSGRPGRGWAWGLLVMLTTAAAGAGVWFIHLQVAAHTFCRPCMVVHVCGGLLGLIVLLRMARCAVGNRRPFRHFLTASLVWLVAGLTAAAALPAGQIMAKQRAPRWHVKPLAAPLTEPRDGRRMLRIPGQESAVDPASLPIVGRPDAAHVAVLFFDYTCGSCREMYENLERIMRQRPAELAVVILPFVANPLCNPSETRWTSDSDFGRMISGLGRCDYGRLAMAVWSQRPGRFMEFDEFLRQPPAASETSPRNPRLPLLPTTEMAARKAGQILGDEALKSVLGSPTPDELLAQYGRWARAFAGDFEHLPVLVTETQVITGAPGRENLDELINAPLASGPVEGPAPRPAAMEKP